MEQPLLWCNNESRQEYLNYGNKLLRTQNPKVLGYAQLLNKPICLPGTVLELDGIIGVDGASVGLTETDVVLVQPGCNKENILKVND